MIYLQYEVLKNKYYLIKEQYDSLLSEKEELFRNTQPKGTDFSKEKINGGTVGNSFDNYLVQMEKDKVDERLEEAKTIFEKREELLKLTEEELKKSNHPHDKIYYYRYINGNMTICQISNLVGYSEPQIYRILKIIRNKIKMIENDRKSMW